MKLSSWIQDEDEDTQKEEDEADCENEPVYSFKDGECHGDKSW